MVKTTVYPQGHERLCRHERGVWRVFLGAGEQLPARTTVEASRLPKDVLVEIELVAEARVPESEKKASRRGFFSTLK